MTVAPTAHTRRALCTKETPCGNCARDIQSAAQARIHQAREASRTLPENTRQCSECIQIKPSSEFGIFMQHAGKTYCCNACQLIKRQAWNANRSVQNSTQGKYSCANNCGKFVSHKDRRCQECYRKVTSQKKTTKRAPKADVVKRIEHECFEHCGATVPTANTRCQTCAKQRHEQIALSTEAKVRRRRVTQSFAKGQTRGILFIGEDAFSLTFICAGINCGKAILTPNKCYTCATGNPINLSVLPKIERHKAV